MCAWAYVSMCKAIDALLKFDLKEGGTLYGSTSKAWLIFKTDFQIINHSVEQEGRVIFVFSEYCINEKL